MIDHATPADRLKHTQARQNCRTLAEANAYREQRGISLRLGSSFQFSAHSTDVAATWARACPKWIAVDDETPMFLRKQAA
jgi:hypothetical protein